MTRSAFLLALSALLGACASTNSRGSDPAPYAGRPSSELPTRVSSAPPMGAAKSSAAPAAPGAADEAPSGALAGEAAARPGLGTSWGETRDSHVSSAPFERNDAQPFALASLYYNDANGVRSMTRGQAAFAAHDGVSVAQGMLSVRLLDSNGMPLPTYEVGAQSYVVGQDGARYVIQIQNHSGRRFEAVTSVDGLDVIDGRPGSFEKRGYLLGPYQSIQIDGFRRNYDEVAAFRFGSVPDSYAARRGDDRNVGVLGVAFFAERGAEPLWQERENERRRNADPFPGRFAPPPPGQTWE